MMSFLQRRRLKKLERQHRALLERARDIQRSGDLRAYAALLEQAEALAEQIESCRRRIEGHE